MSTPAPTAVGPLTGPGPWVRPVPPTMAPLRQTLQQDYGLTFPDDQLAVDATGAAVLAMVLPAGNNLRALLVVVGTQLTGADMLALGRGELDPRHGGLPDDLAGAVVNTTHAQLAASPASVADLAALALEHGLPLAEAVGSMTTGGATLAEALLAVRPALLPPRQDP